MGRIKSRDVRTTITGGTGTVLSAIWSAYALFTTASQLPGDAGAASRMLADPPIYLPYLILAFSVVVLAWSFWPAAEGPSTETEGPISQRATGNNATQIGKAETVNIHHPPARQEPALTSYFPPDHAQRLADRMAATNRERCPEMPIWQAVHHVARIIGDTEENECYAGARAALRQAAVEGRIELWGRKDIAPEHMKDDRQSTVWTKIRRDYWEQYELNPLATAAIYPDREHTWDESLKGRRGNRYWALKADQAEMEREWPIPKKGYDIDALNTGLHRILTGQVGGKRPNLPLAGVLVRVYRKLGGAPRQENRRAEFRRNVDLEIADQVNLNGMSVWGRVNDEPLRPVLNLHTARFDHMSGSVRVKDGNFIHYATFTDLKFCKAEVDEVWPDE